MLDRERRINRGNKAINNSQGITAKKLLEAKKKREERRKEVRDAQ